MYKKWGIQRNTPCRGQKKDKNNESFLIELKGGGERKNVRRFSRLKCINLEEALNFELVAWFVRCSSTSIDIALWLLLRSSPLIPCSLRYGYYVMGYVDV